AYFAEALHEGAKGLGSPELAHIQHNMGCALHLAGELKEAEAAFRQSIDWLEEGEEPLVAALAGADLVALLAHNDCIDEAEDLFDDIGRVLSKDTELLAEVGIYRAHLELYHCRQSQRSGDEDTAREYFGRAEARFLESTAGGATLSLPQQILQSLLNDHRQK
ncbi:MAG: hypothetical protein HN348_15720, partial [Proteobacteria bacterium]|nr:hypothetical protein [Pseudomonadota bacterium]